jgi:imidazolonepropionase-like amidohydrolase
MFVASHTYGGDGLKWAIEARGDDIQHIVEATDEDIQAILRSS